MKENVLGLDNSLSYLYNALRSVGGRILAIEFTHRGRRWRVDTAEEAIKLRHHLETEDVVAGLSDPEFADRLTREQSLWSVDRVWDLLQGIGTQQKQFLAALMRKSRIGHTDMVQELGLSSQVALAGVLSGLTKQMRAMGLAPVSLYHVEHSWKNKKRQRTFSLNRGFVLAARDAGWPDAWKGKKLLK